MNPKVYHQIEDFRDLQMAKYKLRLALDYSEKRLEDHYKQLKTHMTLENLGMEVGHWAIRKLQNHQSHHQNGHAASAPKAVATQQISASKGNQWMEFLPIIISGVFSAIQLFSSRTTDP